MPRRTSPRKGHHFKCVKYKTAKVGGKKRRVCADYEGKGGWYKESKRHSAATKKGEVTRCTGYFAKRPRVAGLFLTGK